MVNTANPVVRLGSLIKSIFVLIAGVYLLTLACYLRLRLLFGDRFWWLSLANTFANLLIFPLLLLVPVGLLLGLRRGALTLVPLTVFGLIWYAPYYLSGSSIDPAATALKTVSFNVWGGNQQMRDVTGWILDSGADVVMLQEVIPSNVQAFLPDWLQTYPYYTGQQDTQRGGGFPSYNITLSRYPIIDIQEIDLGTPGTANPVRAVVDVNGQRIAVYNVHLAWPGGRPRLPIPRGLNNLVTQILVGYNDRARNSQITHLLEHLQTEPYPYIVGGDFNTSDSTPTYNQMAQQMSDSFREAGNGLGGSWPVSSVRGLPSFIPPIIRIDYIWHSAHFAAIDAGQGPPLGSDHLAVTATLALLEPV